MLISERKLRKLIRETLLAETISNTHGYTVNSMSDVKWNSSKASIPKDDNPFVGSSAAFEHWFNDGDKDTMYIQTLFKGTPDELKKRKFNKVVFNPGDFVIIPNLWAKGLTKIFQIAGEGIYHEKPIGVPGVTGTESIALVNLSDASDPGMPITTNVGVAFLRKIGSKQMQVDLADVKRRAMEYMGERADISDEPAAPERGAARSVIRRKAGEPMPERPPMKPAGPVMLSPEDRARLLGSKRE